MRSGRRLVRFDYVFHSGYTRAIKTAAHLLAAYPAEEPARMAVRHHLFIRERDGGHTYDMPNCAVTSYRFDEAARRLQLGDAGRVFWE